MKRFCAKRISFFQSVDGLGQSNPVTYLPTPQYSSRLTNPVVQSTYPIVQFSNPMAAASPLPASTTIPADPDSSSSRPMTPSRTTVPRSIQMMSLSQTAGDADNSAQTTLVPLIPKTTDFPVGVTAPASTPQRVLMTFNNKFSDLGVNVYDVWGNRQVVQVQLAQGCKITTDRITDVYVLSNATGKMRYADLQKKQFLKSVPLLKFVGFAFCLAKIVSCLYRQSLSPCLELRS